MAKRTRQERRTRRARRIRRGRRVRSLLGVAAVLWAINRWKGSAPTQDDVAEPDDDSDRDAVADSRFGKRYYSDLPSFVGDFRAMWANRDMMRVAMRGIDPAFRSRLMLAVTQVNGCRYCSYYHAKAGLQEGLSQSEIDELLAGVDPDGHESIPPGQAVALFYAQHWAETRGAPDTSARERLYDRYGADTAEQIEMLLRAISMGNLMGNTLDYLLFRMGLAAGA